MPHRAPGSPAPSRAKFLSGKPIRYYRPKGNSHVRHLIDEGFQAFNAGRLSEACRVFSEKMRLPAKGSPKNFYLKAQPTLWEVYGIPKGGNDYFIQITTDQVVWGGLSGATPAEAVSWGKANPRVLPDTVVADCDSKVEASSKN